MRVTTVCASKWGAEGLFFHGAEKLEHPFLQATVHNWRSYFLQEPPQLFEVLEIQSWTWNLLEFLLMIFWGIWLSLFFSDGEEKSCWNTREWGKACPSCRRQWCNNIFFYQYYQVQTSRAPHGALPTSYSYFPGASPHSSLDSWKHFAPVLASAQGNSLKSLIQERSAKYCNLQNFRSHFLKNREVSFEGSDFLNGKFVGFSFINVFCEIWSWKGGVIFQLLVFISSTGSYWTESWISSHAFESWNFNKTTATAQLPVKLGEVISGCMNQLRKPSPKFLNVIFSASFKFLWISGTILLNNIEISVLFVGHLIHYFYKECKGYKECKDCCIVLESCHSPTLNMRNM